MIQLKDDRLRDNLISLTTSDADVSHMGAYWLLSPLLIGWGTDDPLVAKLTSDVAEWPTSRLSTITSLLPLVFQDPSRCRSKLLEVGREPTVRGSLAATLHQIGVGPADEDAVSVLLDRAEADGSPWNNMPETIRFFGSNPRVRDAALARASGRHAPLAHIAAAFECDGQLRKFVLDAATPLPSFLRLALASSESTRSPALADLRAGYDRESVPAVKVSLAASHCRMMVAENGDVAAEAANLAELAVAVGPDLEERRSTSFTGLLILGRLELLAGVRIRERPLRFELGSDFRPMPRAWTEGAGRWEHILAAFGEEVLDRIGRFELKPEQVWERLAPNLPATGACVEGFASHCAATPAALGPNALRALASRSPGTGILHEHCWRSLRSSASTLHDELAAVEAIRIPVENFPRSIADAEAAARLARSSGRQSSCMAWCLLDPEGVLASAPGGAPIDYARHGAWLAAFHLARIRSTPAGFVSLVRSAIPRPFISAWNMQGQANLAISRRLAEDAEAAALMARAHLEATSSSERISLPRLLASAGVAEEAVIARCREQLSRKRPQPILESGYDVIADEVRSLPHALREVVSSFASL